MNKKELVAALAERAGMTKEQAANILDILFTTLEDTLSSGEEVRVPNFGTFKVNDRAARTSINPITKKKINVPATKVVKFQPATRLKEAVAGK